MINFLASDDETCFPVPETGLLHFLREDLSLEDTDRNEPGGQRILGTWRKTIVWTKGLTSGTMTTPPFPRGPVRGRQGYNLKLAMFQTGRQKQNLPRKQGKQDAGELQNTVGPGLGNPEVQSR